MSKFGSVSALPSFLAEAGWWEGLFSSKARTTAPPAWHAAREYLACHRYGLSAARQQGAAPDGVRKQVLEIALSLLERGKWTLPSWPMEQSLAASALETMEWATSPASSSKGDLRLRLDFRVTDGQLANILLPCPLVGEDNAFEIAQEIVAQTDRASPQEAAFVRDVLLPTLSLPLLCRVETQRTLESMGVDGNSFFDQRVDFSLETAQGARIVIEIDGSQHNNAAQQLLDQRRDKALELAGWQVWRVPTALVGQPAALCDELKNRLDQAAIRQPSGQRDPQLCRLFWAATAAARIQWLLIDSLLQGAVRCADVLRVTVREHNSDVAVAAIDDLNEWLSRLAGLYGESLPDIVLATEAEAELIVDIDVLHPLRPVADAPCTVAWSRAGVRRMALQPRRLPVDANGVRYFKQCPSEAALDDLVRDLFRKDGFRRDDQGKSLQALITQRILTGQNVVGLLPTGAGKSLPYMLAGLLLPGLTLYVGPLISLLQDQKERLIEAGIDHVMAISSTMNQAARIATLKAIETTDVRFLLVAPERFLTSAFLQALKNRALWQGNINQIVIDECHCVSEWGHDFRPAYLSLGRIARDSASRFGMTAPLVALTGTASTIVLSDVLRELAIDDHDACIRADRMDRPEIELRFAPLLTPQQREAQVEALVRGYIAIDPSPAGGLLVFCPFKGGRSLGVFSVAAHLMNAMPQVEVRFYAGGDAPWNDFAVFRARARDPTQAQIAASTPNWARDHDDNVRPWAELKELLQRDFISGTKKGFRVLVATKAFGMGIDKPSIRRIIHAVAPTSPESYYQEVGRAARDGLPARADLLFCDIHPNVTNQLLDPGRTHAEVSQTYDQFIANNPYGGGDFLRTFYFQRKNFGNPIVAQNAIVDVVGQLDARIANNQDMVIPFGPQGGGANADGGTPVEYAIVRLMHLGVIDGYLKDYNKHVFEIDPNQNWLNVRGDAVQLASYLSKQFIQFVRKYRIKAPDLDGAPVATVNGQPVAAYCEVAKQMMDFIYAHVERRRRQASRQMLELVRIGLNDPAEMRLRLMNYLQVSLRFTELLEQLEPNESADRWMQILADVESPQDLAELHGATQRVLESFPAHPGLLFISAFSRPLSTSNDVERSREEISACLAQHADHGISSETTLAALKAIQVDGAFGKSQLLPVIEEAMGLIHLDIGRPLGDIVPFLMHARVRERWLAVVARDAVHDSSPKRIEASS